MCLSLVGGPQQKLASQAGDADERSRPLKTTQAVYPSTCKDDAVNPGEHHLGGGGQREAATVLLPPNAALETRGPGITVSSRSFPGTSESDSFKRLNFKRLATNLFFLNAVQPKQNTRTAGCGPLFVMCSVRFLPGTTRISHFVVSWLDLRWDACTCTVAQVGLFIHLSRAVEAGVRQLGSSSCPKRVYDLGEITKVHLPTLAFPHLLNKGKTWILVGPLSRLCSQWVSLFR